MFEFSEVSFIVCLDFESHLGNMPIFHDECSESTQVRITVTLTHCSAYDDDQVSIFIWKIYRIIFSATWFREERLNFSN